MSEFFAAISRAIGNVLFWVMVEPWEQAIRVRAGKHVRRLGPGFHWRIPVLDAVYKQSVRLRSCLIPQQTLTTADGHTVVVGAVLSYAIGDIEQLYRELHHAEATIAQLAAAEVSGLVMALGRGDIEPAKVAEFISSEVAKSLAAYGVVSASLRITDFAFCRVFRLLQEGRWSSGSVLNTEPRS